MSVSDNRSDQREGSQKKKGRLVCVGSGIRAIAQFTLEAQACIREADIVYISVADPLTVRWLQEQNPNNFDLYQYYANDRPRHLTYAQMTERMLMDVRAGKFVVSVFYGHPGVFVNPSHDAIAIARSEGYHAKMLPGISAEDCLFADLGIDPAKVGLQTFEATDLLLRKRELQVDTNVIIWQVGCVGDVGFQFTGFENASFPVLLNYLSSYYGEDHKVMHYIAPQYPAGEPVIEEFSIAELRRPEVARKVSGISTFFVPPSVNKVGDAEMAARLGLQILENTPVTPFPQIDLDEYRERRPIAERLLETHEIPEGYPQAAPSEAVYSFMKGLAESYTESLAFSEDRGAYIAAYPGLTAAERRTLEGGHPGAIRLMMQTSAEREAMRFVRDAIIDTELIREYQELIELASRELSEGKWTERQFLDGTRNWLVNRGYLTTVAHVTTSTQGLTATDWTGAYQMYLKQSDGTYAMGPMVILGSSSLTVDGVTISGYALVSSELIWSASSGNPSSAALTFYVDSKTNANAFYGNYWLSGQPEPPSSSFNAAGEFVNSQPLSSWNDTYYAMDIVDGQAQQSGTLTVSDPAVTYNQTIQGYVYGGNQLSWTMAAGNAQNVSITFMTGSDGKPAFYGYKWTSGDKPTTVNFSGTEDSGGPPPPTAHVVAAIVALANANAQAATAATTTANTTAATTATTATTTATTTTVVGAAGKVAKEMYELSRKAGLDVDKVRKASEVLAELKKK